MTLKPKRKSRQLWLSGVMGCLSTAASTVMSYQPMADIVKPYIPSWGYGALLGSIALYSIIMYRLRLTTTEPLVTKTNCERCANDSNDKAA